MNETVRYNLGSGVQPLPGYMNLDIKTGKSAFPLECQDNSLDEIRASHLLEHFSHRRILDVLKNWVSKLKVGGLLKIAVPDFKKIAQTYVGGGKINALGYLMGGHIDEYDKHGSIFDAESLSVLMKTAGLDKISVWQSEITDAASLPISLNLCGVKGENAGTAEGDTKVSAVMSMPRLAFTENMFCAMRATQALGISLSRGCGVFWGQVLSRMMEMHLEDGTEWILTIDYDTWFTHKHVMRLCQLMAEHPEADAIIPIQVGREMDLPLMGKRDEKGQVQIRADVSEFERSLTPIVTGHFGLTLFRVSSLKKFPRPWFLPVPGPDGRWGDGRIDEDISFWNKFAESGLKAFAANEVSIGHLQHMCTFPGLAKDNWQPIHVYMNDVETGKCPAHCEPVVELLT